MESLLNVQEIDGSLLPTCVAIVGSADHTNSLLHTIQNTVLRRWVTVIVRVVWHGVIK